MLRRFWVWLFWDKTALEREFASFRAKHRFCEVKEMQLRLLGNTPPVWITRKAARYRRILEAIRDRLGAKSKEGPLAVVERMYNRYDLVRRRFLVLMRLVQKSGTLKDGSFLLEVPVGKVINVIKELEAFEAEDKANREEKGARKEADHASETV